MKEKSHTESFCTTENFLDEIHRLIGFSDKSEKSKSECYVDFFKKLLLNNSSPPPSDKSVTTEPPQGAEVTAPLLSIPNIGNASETIDSGFSEKQKQKLRFEQERARIKIQAKIDAEKGVQVVKEQVKRYRQKDARGRIEDYGSGNGGMFSDIIGWV